MFGKLNRSKSIEPIAFNSNQPYTYRALKTPSKIRVLALFPRFRDEVNLKGQLFYISLDDLGGLLKGGYQAVLYI